MSDELPRAAQAQALRLRRVRTYFRMPVALRIIGGLLLMIAVGTLLLMLPAAIAVVLRLNLLFTSRVHASMLPAHRARLFPWVVAAESLLAVVLLVSAFALGTESDTTAAPLLSVGLILVASLAIIEPATTSGAGLRAGGAQQQNSV